MRVDDNLVGLLDIGVSGDTLRIGVESGTMFSTRRWRLMSPCRPWMSSGQRAPPRSGWWIRLRETRSAFDLGFQSTDRCRRYRRRHDRPLGMLQCGAHGNGARTGGARERRESVRAPELTVAHPHDRALGCVAGQRRPHRHAVGGRLHPPLRRLAGGREVRRVRLLEHRARRLARVATLRSERTVITRWRVARPQSSSASSRWSRRLRMDARSVRRRPASRFHAPGAGALRGCGRRTSDRHRDRTAIRDGRPAA